MSLFGDFPTDRRLPTGKEGSTMKALVLSLGAQHDVPSFAVDAFFLGGWGLWPLLIQHSSFFHHTKSVHTINVWWDIKRRLCRLRLFGVSGEPSQRVKYTYLVVHASKGRGFIRNVYAKRTIGDECAWCSMLDSQVEQTGQVEEGRKCAFQGGMSVSVHSSYLIGAYPHIPQEKVQER